MIPSFSLPEVEEDLDVFVGSALTQKISENVNKQENVIAHILESLHAFLHIPHPHAYHPFSALHLALPFVSLEHSLLVCV